MNNSNFKNNNNRNQSRTSGRTTDQPKTKDTSWHKVANWYNEHLDNSDSFHQTVIIPQLFPLLKQFIPNINKTRVLDLACGQGILTRELARNGYQVVGVDSAKGLLKIAQENKQDQSQNSANIHYKLANAETLNIGELGKFDLIICVLAIQNFENPEKVFNNCSHLLNPGGKFVFVINHPCFRIPRQSGWGWDEARKLQYRRMDSYASTQKIPIQLHPFKAKFAQGASAPKVANPVTWSFHHSLTDYFTYLERAKFTISHLEEWYSQKQSQLGKTGKAENKAREEFPMFLTVIADLK